MKPYYLSKGITFNEVSGGGTSLTYQSLEMHTLPSTLDYSVGDLLSFDGMEIFALYSDGTDTYMKDVTDIATPSIAEGTPITEDMSEITFTYTDGKTDSVSYEISVTSLPEGYTQKNYIEHSSSGFFALESYKLAKTDIIVADIAVPRVTASVSDYNEGIIAVFRSDNYSCVVGTYTWNLNNITARPTKSTTPSVTLNGLEELKARCKLKIDMTGSEITVGTQENDISAISIPTANQYYLNIGEVINSRSWANIQIYGIKIFNANEEVVANYIPCTNPSNTAGLYESVSKQFNSNSSWIISG